MYNNMFTSSCSSVSALYVNCVNRKLFLLLSVKICSSTSYLFLKRERGLEPCISFFNNHINGGGTRTKLHINPLQHMWIEVNPTTSKQCLRGRRGKKKMARRGGIGSLRDVGSFFPRFVVSLITSSSVLLYKA